MLDLKICSNRWYRFEHWRTTTIYRNHPEKKGLPQTSFRKTIIRNSTSLAIDIYIITIWKHLFISTLISTERMLIFKCYLMKEKRMFLKSFQTHLKIRRQFSKWFQNFVDVQFLFTRLHLRFIFNKNLCIDA